MDFLSLDFNKIYEESFLEPELKPEYLEKLMNIDREKGIPFRDLHELRKVIEG